MNFLLCFLAFCCTADALTRHWEVPVPSLEQLQPRRPRLSSTVLGATVGINGSSKLANYVVDCNRSDVEAKTRSADQANEVEGTKNEDLAASPLLLQAARDAPVNIPSNAHSMEYMNRFLLGILIFLAGAFVVGRFLDTVWQERLAKGQASCAVLCPLAASYMLLPIAIYGPLSAYEVTLTLHFLITKKTFYVSKTADGTSGPVSESAAHLMKTWFTDDVTMWLAAFLLLLYAVLIPATKVVLVILGERWRCSDDENKALWARWCISILHCISKWAAPDAFVYMLMCYLFRTIDAEPTTVAGSLDIGFTSFTVFVLASTFTTLGIPIPSVKVASGLTPRWLTPSSGQSLAHDTWFSSGGVYLVAACVLGFYVAFFFGVTKPAMAMSLDKQKLIDDSPLPGLLKGPFAPIKIGPVERDPVANLEASTQYVSVATCASCMLSWYLQTGELNCLLSSATLGIFVMFLPVVSMTLQLAAVAAGASGAMDAKDASSRSIVSARLARLATFLQHISMLDVFVMGVLVVVLATQSFKDNGMVTKLGTALPWLCVAVALQTVVSWNTPTPNEDAERISD